MLSTPLNDACYKSDTKRVKQLLDGGAPVDARAEDGRTALMCASDRGHTEVVKLLLDWNASVNEKKEDGWTALMKASRYGRTEVVKLLLDMGASVDEKDKDGMTALLLASARGDTEVVQLLLHKGASVGVKDNAGSTALPTVIAFDEDQLGRMAAAQLHRLLPQGQSTDLVHAEEVEEEERTAFAEATGTAVLQLVRLAGFACARARALRSSDPRSADDHQALFGRLQLAAAACIQNDESGKARGEYVVQKLFRSDDGRKALEYAVQIKAKELLVQPVVQTYVQLTWRGELVNLPGSAWVVVLIIALLQLLFLLPLVALVPPLEPWLTKKLDLGDGNSLYLLRAPVVKFYLGCAADLALALALTFIPAADLATAPFAPLLFVWIGSGLLWEGGQLMASSSDASSRLSRAYDRAGAYWVHNLNRVDTAVLIFSLAALTAAVSADDTEDTTAWSLATTTSLRAAAVFLLWFRLIRLLLVSQTFMPFVMMFFDMIFGDLLRFLVLLLFLLVAFAASWTVLLEPPPWLVEQQFGDDQNWRWREPLSLSPLAHLETDDCADELGGIDIFSTLIRLLEGALTGNDHFECARDSTKSPLAIWVFSFVYVMLTTVLLLNMLIAMCAAA